MALLHVRPQTLLMMMMYAAAAVPHVESVMCYSCDGQSTMCDNPTTCSGVYCFNGTVTYLGLISISAAGCETVPPESLGCSDEVIQSFPVLFCRCVADYCNLPIGPPAGYVPPSTSSTLAASATPSTSGSVVAVSVRCFQCSDAAGISCDSPTTTCVGRGCSNTTLVGGGTSYINRGCDSSATLLNECTVASGVRICGCNTDLCNGPSGSSVLQQSTSTTLAAAAAAATTTMRTASLQPRQDITSTTPSGGGIRCFQCNSLINDCLRPTVCAGSACVNATGTQSGVVRIWRDCESVSAGPDSCTDDPSYNVRRCRCNSEFCNFGPASDAITVSHQMAYSGIISLMIFIIFGQLFRLFSVESFSTLRLELL